MTRRVKTGRVHVGTTTTIGYSTPARARTSSKVRFFGQKFKFKTISHLKVKFFPPMITKIVNYSTPDSVRRSSKTSTPFLQWSTKWFLLDVGSSHSHPDHVINGAHHSAHIAADNHQKIIASSTSHWKSSCLFFELNRGFRSLAGRAKSPSSL